MSTAVASCTEPFEQRDDESAKAFAAFRAYRDLPPSRRSVLAAYKQTSGRDVTDAPRGWQGWSAENDWPARARAWDAQLDRIARQDAIETRRKTLQNLHGTGSFLVSAGLKRLQDLLEKEPHRVSATSAVRAVEVGASLMRDSLETPIPQARVEGDIDDVVSQLIEHYRDAALGGDRDAARLLLAAVQRKAQADGTDAPQKVVGVVATLQEVLGGWSPDDLPPAIQAELVAHLESQTVDAVEEE